MRARWLLPLLRLKLRTLFRGEQIDRELDEEIRYHLERKTEQLIASGLSPEDARRAARRAFGGVEQRKEDCRDARGAWASIWVERLSQDLRHGARLLARNPGFTLIATLSIAIGVGANAAMFSYADGVIFRPLPVPDAGGLLALGATTPTGEVRNDGVSYPDYADLRNQARSFEGLTAVRPVVTGLARSPGDVATGRLGFAVSANFFDVLRVRPALGRAFAPDEDRLVGRDAVAMLAYDTWTREFGADPHVVGRPIRLAGVPFTVIGVAPEGFSGTSLYLPPAFYVPLAMLPTLDGEAPAGLLERRDVRTLRVFGRLSPAVSLAQANQEVDLLARTLQEKYPATNQRRGLLVRRQMDARRDENAPAAVFGGMVIGLALAVLLVACANVAQLLTSRAPAREREIAVRMAIGGSRARLVRQLITESVLIAATGGAIGLLLAYGGIRSFQLQYANDSGIRLTFALDRRALMAGLGVAALSALLSSAVPAWRSTRLRDLSRALRNTTAHGLPTSRLWGRHGLVALQMALTLILLTVALSFYRAFEAEYGDGPGFRTDRLLLTTLDPGLARHDQRQSDTFYGRLKARAAAIPNVRSMAVTSFVPLGPDDGSNTSLLVPEGVELPPGVDNFSIASARVDEGYFDTFAIAIVSGRGIQATDDSDAPSVAVVSRGMADRFWPGQDPVGKRIRLVGPNRGWTEVVGVAADVHFALLGPASTPFLYLSRLQHPSTRATLVVRTETDSAALADPVRAAILEIDHAVPIIGMHTMEAFYDANVRNLNTVLVRTIAGMGTMGLLLALCGLYGLTAYIVSRRTREIGIRMALGALPASVLAMILRQGLMPSVTGLALGVLASAAVGRLVQATFPGPGPDAVMFALIVPLMVVVVMLAAYIPARRAARLDPVATIRQE